MFYYDQVAAVSRHNLSLQLHRLAPSHSDLARTTHIHTNTWRSAMQSMPATHAIHTPCGCNKLLLMNYSTTKAVSADHQAAALHADLGCLAALLPLLADVVQLHRPNERGQFPPWLKQTLCLPQRSGSISPVNKMQWLVTGDAAEGPTLRIMRSDCVAGALPPRWPAFASCAMADTGARL